MAEPIVLPIIIRDDGSIQVLDKVAQAVGKSLPAAVEQANKALAGLTATTNASGQVFNKLGQEVTGRAAEALKRLSAETVAGAKAQQGLNVNWAAGVQTGAQLALGFSTIAGGLQLLKTGVVGTVESLANFEARLNDVYTLGIRSTEAQQGLRAELLKLPPTLGDSTTLAKGLYEVLSAGIEPAKSVQFLETAARLAKAGLGDLDTATVALTKTLTAYQLPVEQAAEVSETLFKTVVVGQGRLNDFASALPGVTQFSANLGISFKDTAAALAVLSLSFRSTREASTGFRGLLEDLIQNADKFRAAGVDIADAIKQGGIIGLVDALRIATKGTAEGVRSFIGDVRAQQAALALIGPEYDRIVKTQQDFQKNTDEVGEAIKLQTQGLKAAWEEFGNTIDRVIQEEGAPVTGFLSGLVRGLTEVIATSKDTPEALQVTGNALDGLVVITKKAAEGGALSIKDFEGAIQNLAGTATSFDQQGKILGLRLLDISEQAKDATLAQQVFAIALRAEGEAAAQTEKDVGALNIIVDKFKVSAKGPIDFIDPLKIERDIKTASDLFNRLADNGKVSFAAILRNAELMTEGIRQRMGFIPPTWQAVLDDLRERARTELGKIPQLFERLGLQTKEALQKTAVDSAKDLQALVTLTGQKTTETFALVRDAQGRIISATNAGLETTSRAIGQSTTATTQDMLKKFHDVVEQINKGEFKTLPKELQESLNLFAPIAKKAGEGTVRVIKDEFDNLKVVFDGVGKAGKATLDPFIDGLNTLTALLGPGGVALQGYENQARQLSDALGITRRQVDSLEGSIKGLSDQAVRMGHTLDASGEEVSAYGGAVARLSDETERLYNVQARFERQFATTAEGLRKQLREQEQELNRLGELGQGAYLGLAGYDFFRERSKEVQAEIRKRLAELEAETVATTTGTRPAPGAGTRPVPTSGAGGLAGRPVSLPGPGGTQGPASLGIRPVFPPGVVRPLAPSDVQRTELFPTSPPMTGADLEADLGVRADQLAGAKRLLDIFNETGNQEIRRYLTALQEGFADSADQIAYNTEVLQEANTAITIFKDALGNPGAALTRAGETIVEYTLQRTAKGLEELLKRQTEIFGAPLSATGALPRDLRPLTPSDLPGVALVPRPRPLFPSAPPRPTSLLPGQYPGQSAFVPAGTTLAPAPAPLFPAQTSSDRAGGGGFRGGTLGGASTGVNQDILRSPTIGGATTRGGVTVQVTNHFSMLKGDRDTQQEIADTLTAAINQNIRRGQIRGL
jgi:TP901 family phage tail tape measure protein